MNNCAPGVKKDSNGSCLPKGLARSVGGCRGDLCVAKKLGDERLLARLRPEKPAKWLTKPDTWLDTNNINAVMRQYERAYPRFKYIGTLPMDAYEAKRDGKGQARAFRSELHERELRQFTFRSELRSALELGQLAVVYQPIVDMETEVGIPAAPSEIRHTYRNTVQEALDEWRSALGRAGARYALAFTDEPFGRPLRYLVGVNGRGAMV